MATISPSDAAPSEQVHYTLAGGEFDLGGRKKSYETDDVDILIDAAVHPWLTVVYPEVESEANFVPARSPQEDALSQFNSIANDPEAVEAAAVDYKEGLSPQEDTLSHFMSIANDPEAVKAAHEAVLEAYPVDVLAENPVQTDPDSDDVPAAAEASDDAEEAKTSKTSDKQKDS